jgi:hypothetical protein
VTSDPIRAAIEQLRADLDGLPTWARRDWHVHAEAEVCTSPLATVVARCDLTGGFAKPVVEHIALTASPHVTEALIALLEALDDMTANVRPPLLALATAITRRDS